MATVGIYTKFRFSRRASARFVVIRAKCQKCPNFSLYSILIERLLAAAVIVVLKIYVLVKFVCFFFLQ